MLYIDDIWNNTIRISNTVGGDVYKTFSKPLIAMSNEIGRVSIINKITGKVCLDFYDISQIMLNGNTYDASTFVRQFNIIGALGSTPDSVTTTTTTIAISTTTTTLLNQFTIPADFTFAPISDLKIKWVGGKAVIDGYTIDSFRKVIASPVVKYVDAVNGLDTNNGNTAVTAYKTFTKLVSVSWDRAYLAAGCYASANSIYLADDKEIIGASRDTVFIARGYVGTELTWTDTGGGVFTTPATANQLVTDCALINADGDPTALIKVANAAAVAATAGTFFRDTGTNTLYVRMYDDLTPSRATVLVSNAILAPAPGKQIYVEGVTIVMGAFVFNNNTATLAKCCFKNAKTVYNPLTNGLSIEGNVYTWIENSIVRRMKDDGISYKEYGGYQAYGIEDGVLSENHGGAENYGLLNSINNASTAHNSCKVLRLNGIYRNTEGRVVHDVNASQSLNINCVAGESTSVAAGSKVSWGVGVVAAETAKMWLDKCTGGSATTYGAENVATPTSHLYAKNSTITNVKSGTTLETY